MRRSLLDRISERLSRVITKTIIRPLEFNSCPYATHLPILVAIGLIARPQTVLELGAGRYSTPTFLNPDIFPQLRQLTSIEDDRTWLETVKTEIGENPRWKPVLVPSIPETVTHIWDAGCDLIFVDDSSTESERARTLRSIASRLSDHQLMVIHDFERTLYRVAVRKLRYHVFDSLTPQTGIAATTRTPHFEALAASELTIRQAVGETGVTDIAGWTTRFHCYRP
jgi:hypothetical protein